MRVQRYLAKSAHARGHFKHMHSIMDEMGGEGGAKCILQLSNIVALWAVARRGRIKGMNIAEYLLCTRQQPERYYYDASFSKGGGKTRLRRVESPERSLLISKAAKMKLQLNCLQSPCTSFRLTSHKLSGKLNFTATVLCLI